MNISKFQDKIIYIEVHHNLLILLVLLLLFLLLLLLDIVRLLALRDRSLSCCCIIAYADVAPASTPNEWGSSGNLHNKLGVTLQFSPHGRPNRAAAGFHVDTNVVSCHIDVMIVVVRLEGDVKSRSQQLQLERDAGTRGVLLSVDGPASGTSAARFSWMLDLADADAVRPCH